MNSKGISHMYYNISFACGKETIKFLDKMIKAFSIGSFLQKLYLFKFFSFIFIGREYIISSLQYLCLNQKASDHNFLDEYIIIKTL